MKEHNLVPLFHYTSGSLGIKRLDTPSPLSQRPASCGSLYPAERLPWPVTNAHLTGASAGRRTHQLTLQAQLDPGMGMLALGLWVSPDPSVPLASAWLHLYQLQSPGREVAPTALGDTIFRAALPSKEHNSFTPKHHMSTSPVRTILVTFCEQENGVTD